MATDTDTATAAAPLPDLGEVQGLLAGLTELSQTLVAGETDEGFHERLRDLTTRAVDLARPVVAAHGMPLLRYSMYLHVGAGAQNCDDGEDGTCGDPLHFHSWLRLPNQFQHNEIREKALAAQARRQRLLRDEDSDARLVLDEELEALRRGDDEQAKKALVYELVNVEGWMDQLEALKEVGELDEYEHVDQDQVRLHELEAEYKRQISDTAAQDVETPEPAEELTKLREHFEAYAVAVEKALNELQAPKFEALNGKELDDLIGLVREQRIEEDGKAEFMHTYSLWTWVYGTYTTKQAQDGKHRTRRFSGADAVKEAEPEVITALQTAFRELESVMGRGPAGNP